MTPPTSSLTLVRFHQFVYNFLSITAEMAGWPYMTSDFGPLYTCGFVDNGDGSMIIKVESDGITSRDISRVIFLGNVKTKF